MTRALRIKYKNALYHITSRGNERRNIFENGSDRDFFLKTLKESLNTYHVILYSYVLMSNHFHLLLETPLSNISEFMNQFNITYTIYYNRKYKRVGHLLKKEKEIPSVKKIHSYCTRDKIVEIACREIGTTWEQLTIHRITIARY